MTWIDFVKFVMAFSVLSLLVYIAGIGLFCFFRLIGVISDINEGPALKKEQGLRKNYAVTKLSDPNKQVDAIVLEFDDPIARKGIKAWANEMIASGYKECGNEVLDKINSYQTPNTNRR